MAGLSRVPRAASDAGKIRSNSPTEITHGRRSKNHGGRNASGGPTGPGAVPQFTVDATGLLSTYTNWYRVTGTPEELVIDFGLNPQMGQVPTEPIKLTTRLVMNFYTAKRLLNALQFAVQRPREFLRRRRGGRAEARPRLPADRHPPDGSVRNQPLAAWREEKRLPCWNWGGRNRRSFHGPLGERRFKESRDTVSGSTSHPLSSRRSPSRHTGTSGE